MRPLAGRSFNGRTRGSGPCNRGSNPCLPANLSRGTVVDERSAQPGGTANSRHPLLKGTRNRLPFDEGPRSQYTIMGRPQQMSGHPEEILHHAVDRREALQMDGRLEAPYLTLTLSRRLMRHFGAIVRILIRTVEHRRHHRAVRGRVTAELVGDQPAGGTQPWRFSNVRKKRTAARRFRRDCARSSYRTSDTIGGSFRR